MPERDDHEERVGEAVAWYFQAVEAGRAPEPADFLARYPDLRLELESFLADKAAFERAAGPPTDPEATLPPSGTPNTDTIAHVPSGGEDVTLPAPGPETAAGGPLGSVRYFGDYELLAEIARGGMGVVFKARQVSLNREVALKMILSGQLAGAADIARFRTEAESAANLDHPNILPIYEVGEHQGQQYFAMKLVPGGSLAAKVTELVKDLRAAVSVFAKVCRAIDFAHRRGILHRDLKPGNILLDADGTPYVTDFGLAKKVEGDSNLTQSGAIVGTPSYMAPEQARAEKGLTTAADVYALGAILYELLTGQPPFRGPTVVDTILQVLEKEPADPRSLNPKADRDLSVIALKCLEKDAGKRYESAAALADDLDRWTRGEPILARPVSTIEQARKWVRRNPVIAALAAAVAVVCLGMAAAGIVAVDQARKAQTREADAVRARHDADREADTAHQAQSAEAAQRAVAEAALYRARIAVAHAAWQGNEVQRARQTLDECPVIARGWEWHYLRRLCETGLLTLGADRGTFRCVDYSPDGKHLAGGAADAVVVWEVESGKEVKVLPGAPDRGPTICVKFSPDGKLLVAGRGPATSFNSRTGGSTTMNGPSELVAWDWPAGTERFRIPLDSPPGPFVFTAVGNQLVVPGFKNPFASTDVAILDALTGKEVHRLKDAGTLPALGENGKTLYVGRWNGMSVWDSATWAMRSESKLEANRVLAVDPSSGLMATVELASASSGSALLYDAKAEHRIARYDAHSGPVQAVVFDGNRHLITCGSDGRVRVWSADERAWLSNTFNGHSGSVFGVAATMRAGSRRVATAGGDVKLWNPNRGQESYSPNTLFMWGFPPMLSKSGRLAIAANNSLIVVGLDPEGEWGGDQTLTPEQSKLHAATAWDGEDMIALFKSSEGKPATIWNARTKKEVAKLEAKLPIPVSVPVSVDLRPSAGLIAVFGKDNPTDPKAPPGGTLWVSDTRTGKTLWSTRLARNAMSMSLSPTADRLLVTELSDRTVTRPAGPGVTYHYPIADECRVHDARTGEVLWSMKDAIWGAEFATNGSVLVRTGSGDRIDRLVCRDAATVAERWQIALAGEPQVLVTSPDGALFAYADDRPGGMRGLEVRSLETGAVVTVLPQEAASAGGAAAFTPDGSRLAVGRADGSIRIWDPRAGAELLTLRGHKGEVVNLVFTSNGGKLVSVAQDQVARVWNATPTRVP